MTRLIALWFGAGMMRPGPGTWGSLAALPFAWALHTLGGLPLFALAIVALYPLGLWAVRAETKGRADADPSEIVVDEVIGQWIALLPVSIGAWAMGAEPLALWPGVISAVLCFRLFDIWKPGLVGRMDRRGDPEGVMLDDVAAGIFAALATLALAAIGHGVMML
ncbi:phosphatidylglycerophosphatase A family protein [Poseidonocella sedimentorum]|uniref:Phosphatidylglycerophosphatase A n=1 Tax=Poseidonocella sedimentorum TaxID=871652 RepID=A0A1I6E813_9RHOB|nr:phosphatidylglycerophosphatase A [Poseidonocella sedimentorum]SFR13874.1 phosphatidylglycerophosphatase A [Poseidonocella sedimentorum]